MGAVTDVENDARLTINGSRPASGADATRMRFNGARVTVKHN